MRLFLFFVILFVVFLVDCKTEPVSMSATAVEKEGIDAEEAKAKKNSDFVTVDEKEVQKTEEKYIKQKEMIYFRDKRVKLCFGMYSSDRITSVTWVPCSKKLDQYIEDEIE